MYERPSAIVIAASLVLAWPAAAAEKPAGADVQPAAQPVAQERAETVLASVDTAKLPQPIKAADGQPAPKKRAARVTTCRCADVVAEQR
jgi:hypothetical protein